MKAKSILSLAVLVFSLVLMAISLSAQTPGTSSGTSSASSSNSQSDAAAQVDSIPIDKLVTATCRQAWHLGGRNQDGFYAIVARLAQLSAHNRGVTLPDDQSAGARAGEWIRTQALKDPDQLLYAVVDQAVQHSIAKGRATPTNASNQ
jgi:hypothetical protein